MKLKKIELLGFKSFADKIVLSFHPGITAIVGPNGCGKSNISDAFRWVLGEQSAKSMRGNKMHDVIFAGTGKRKPLNLAEVTLTFSDVEGKLPTDYEEVSATRRLHRNGESDYLINRRPVRLKDVYDLFLDSGIGKDAFSIFEQGKIEQVINLSPLERRYIFEEAAGILRFLQRKREALRRLEQTEQNIDRVKDIHQEVERQIIVLEEQAEKAKSFKVDKAELERLEIGLLTAKWDLLEEKAAANKEQGEVKRIEIDQVSREIANLEIGRQNGSILLAEVQKELQSQKEKVFQTRGEKEIKAKERQGSEERLREMALKEKQWSEELDGMVERRKTRQVEIKQAQHKQKSVEGELTGLDGVRREQVERVHALEQEVGGLRDRQHAEQKVHLELLQQENRIESELKQVCLRLEHHTERQERILENQRSLANHSNELREAIQEKEKVLTTLDEELRIRKEQFEMVEVGIAERTERIKDIQGNLDKIYQEKAEQKARQNVLLRLRDEMEGFSSGTKKLLQESSRMGSVLHNKVTGLYQSLAPRRGGEMPLSVVMRAYTQTLVVKNPEDFDAVVAYAKEKKIRDFSLICLDQASRNSPWGSIEGAESLLSLVDEHVLAEHFLNRVYLAKNREEAIKLSRQMPGIQVWVNEGLFIDSHGVVFYTSEGENNVFLREAELKVLEEKLQGLEETRSSYEEKLKDALQMRSELQSRKQSLDQETRKQEMKIVEEKYSLQRLVSDEEKTKKDSEKEHGEAAALAKSSEELKGKQAALHRQHAAAKGKAEEMKASVEILSEELEALLGTLKVQQQDLRDKENAYHKVADEKRKIVHMLNVFEVKDLESLQQEKRLEQEIEGIKEKHHQLQLSRVSFEQDLQVIEAALAEVQEGCNELEKKVLEKKNTIDQIEREIAVKREELKQKESVFHDLSILNAQMDSSRQALESELRERFQLSIPEAKEKEIVLEKSIDRTEREARALRRKMEEAGDINMTSIEEFDKYKERYEFLNLQIADLTSSKQELVEIITQLDSESRKIFRETFEIIRENFKKNFQILFTGGESDLLFTENADILEAGIEIVAKPPGKQMRSINLMSGGEKCLTAVALLFAIFEVKPAPFCILDEIDAPLDDTNVDRFLNVVKQFTDRCQFIIITHNKRTMSIADRLYGVSMQEKGVSKILSLEFSSEKEPEPALV